MAFEISINNKPYDVGEHYQREHQMKLPPTPTMSGSEIKLASGCDPTYGAFLRHAEGRHEAIEEARAMPLSPGMDFWVLPPAHY